MHIHTHYIILWCTSIHRCKQKQTMICGRYFLSTKPTILCITGVNVWEWLCSLDLKNRICHVQPTWYSCLAIYIWIRKQKDKDCQRTKGKEDSYMHRWAPIKIIIYNILTKTSESWWFSKSTRIQAWLRVGGTTVIFSTRDWFYGFIVTSILMA